MSPESNEFTIGFSGKGASGLARKFTHSVRLIYGRRVNANRRVNHANNVLMSRSYNAHPSQKTTAPVVFGWKERVPFRIFIGK